MRACDRTLWTGRVLLLGLALAVFGFIAGGTMPEHGGVSGASAATPPPAATPTPIPTASPSPVFIPGWLRSDLFPTGAAIVERSGPWRGGTRTYFEFAVRNGGLLPAGPFTITVRMSGFPDRTITAITLLPGQSQTFRELTERPEPGGCRTYAVFVDSGHAVTEIDESNNADSTALCGAVPAD